MDQKKIKLALKDAREAIKAKDFGNTIKICKHILKYDKENYMALVFLGVSLQEVGQNDQAPHSFRKAIAVDANQQLAWNGLANYYEKDDSDTASKELIQIYEKLLDMEKDASKFGDMCSKLVARALKLQEVNETANILYRLTMKQELSEYNRRTTWLALASLLIQFPNLPRELLTMYVQTLSTVVKERTSVTCDYYKEYLKLLYKMKNYLLLLAEAKIMHNMYQTNLYPLEWICKVFCEMSVECNNAVKHYISDIDVYIQNLICLQEDSVLGLFALAVRAYDVENYIDARNTLKTVLSMRPRLAHAWVLLARSLLQLFCYDEAAEAGFKADKLLKSMSVQNEPLRTNLDRNMLGILAKHSSPEKWIQAVELGRKLLSENDEDYCIMIPLLLAYTNLNMLNEAEDLLNNLEINTVGPVSYALVHSKLLRSRGNLVQALNILNELNVDSNALCIERGTLYWELEEYEKCLEPFLKAAKIDPNNYMCFVYLARYYDYAKDVDKARRCYQKAFKINPRCMEAGMHLSNIYRQQKNWVSNLELLQSVTGVDSGIGLRIISADVRWAWLQLGLHYLEQGEFNNAIDILRSIIRVEPDNGHYWECLADAYTARGAYTAALKSYERAAELSDDILYPKLQVATIKLMLGHYEEANLEFVELLKHNDRYVPALKGIAENSLNLAVSQYRDQLQGLCRDNAQRALDNLTIALKERSDLSCLWKLTGDSCLLVATLPDKYSTMSVKATLAEGRESDEVFNLNKSQLFILTARCYCKAISLNKTNLLLWHDLAVCYYSHACSFEDSSGIYLERGLSTAMYCVKNNPACWYHWNLLGRIAVHKDIKKYSLAQHAFIKAVTLEHNSAAAWSNLGTLYLILGDIQLANKAFSQAQRGEPGYVNSWIGQAVIAEIMHHEDAMDLFRHSTQLGHHSQGALGYAHWVCRTITEAEPYAHIYSIHNMHAIPVACDALTWYTENRSDNACAWNMLGLLQERLRLNKSALEAFKLSMDLVEEEYSDKVLINLARSLVHLKRYDEAIVFYRQIKKANFNGGCGLALALFKAKQYEESYESYDTAMQWLTENENLQSHVLVALAAMAYMFQGPESAKTLLFQSTQLKPPSPWGLYATLALGLLHGDITLAQLVLKELQDIKDNAEVIQHYSMLQASIYWMQDDKKNTQRSLCKSVHRHPDQPILWLHLAILLLKFDPKSKSAPAAKCAHLAMSMGRSEMDVTKVLCITSLASYVSKDAKKALSFAQRAVHCYPDVAEGWAMLIAAVKLFSNTKNNWNRQYDWIQESGQHVINNLNSSENLSAWIRKFTLH